VSGAGGGWKPDRVGTAAEGFGNKAPPVCVFGGLPEAEGYRYPGSPPLSILVTRNKAMTKEILSYRGVSTPGFVTYRANETVKEPPPISFPLIVKPLQADASEGIAQASVVSDLESLAER